MSSTLIENRTIRVFISSTFQDMQDERSELIRKTFPRLREMARERDVTLTEVDLRWGITKEESESGKVMEICLREVENSIPFFIGIIGNRYGWIPAPKDISEIVKERFPKVPEYVERHLSATEIEMQFGVLARTDMDLNAFFFIKEGEASDVDDPERLAALKKAVLENKKYPVSSYSTPEDLATQVLVAFTKLLDELFPVGELSALEKERLGQRAVLNNLSRVYIETESNFAVIDEWIEDWEKHQLVITGASGLGKSALVAN
jgi:preprotein translocase subunit SecA/nephrocystin-3